MECIDVSRQYIFTCLVVTYVLRTYVIRTLEFPPFFRIVFQNSLEFLLRNNINVNCASSRCRPQKMHYNYKCSQQPPKNFGV